MDEIDDTSDAAQVLNVARNIDKIKVAFKHNSEFKILENFANFFMQNLNKVILENLINNSNNNFIINHTNNNGPSQRVNAWNVGQTVHLLMPRRVASSANAQCFFDRCGHVLMLLIRHVLACLRANVAEVSKRRKNKPPALADALSQFRILLQPNIANPSYLRSSPCQSPCRGNI